MGMEARALHGHQRMLSEFLCSCNHNNTTLRYVKIYFYREIRPTCKNAPRVGGGSYIRGRGRIKQSTRLPPRLLLLGFRA